MAPEISGAITINTQIPILKHTMVTQLEMGRRVEEEDTFRTVPSTNLVSNSEVNSEDEDEDDEVDRVDDELDANKTMKQNSVDDMENQGNEILDDRAKINEEEAEKVETNCINGSHQDGWEKEPVHEESHAQRKSGGGEHIENCASCENINEESNNYDHGLDSIAQDSQSPLAEECVESVQKNFQLLNAEPNLGDNQDQEKGVNQANNSGVYESDVSIKASQLPDINLHIELNQSAARRNTRSTGLWAGGKGLIMGGETLFERLPIVHHEHRVNTEPEQEDRTVLVGHGSQGPSQGNLAAEHMEVAY
ncbi:hypothetical protein RHGRI_002704 [Rhododendron griersonianum]|uniref:Uncharacterized protein n=1 Tax=Rhododendron griersonianum TaxID=479676 RepID=A0AAV6LT93_9ERIC|nr:hypothetical protein RHGRI_002704 [Rhododendron griersonianum]